MRRADVCAGVTAYFPDGAFEERLKAIADQVELVIVVDNSPADFGAGRHFPDNVEVHSNMNQGGMAGALNIAMRRARELGFKYFVTFDQDSTVPNDLVEKLIDASIAMSAAIVGPNFRNAATKAPGRFYLSSRRLRSPIRWFPRAEGFHEALVVITSGMLIDLQALPVEVKYREQLLVDFVDIDFCLKARAMGLKIAVNTDISMSHGLGNKAQDSWRFSSARYGAPRRYLATRNRIIVWREHYLKYPGFVGSDIFVAIADMLRTLLLEPEKLKTLRAFYSGAREGFRMARRSSERAE